MYIQKIAAQQKLSKPSTWRPSLNPIGWYSITPTFHKYPYLFGGDVVPVEICNAAGTAAWGLLVALVDWGDLILMCDLPHRRLWAGCPTINNRPRATTI